MAEVSQKPATVVRGVVRRFAVPFVIAVVSDLLSLGFEFVPPLEWTLDAVTALALFLTLGRHWFLLVPLVCEAIPGIAAFPTWVLVVSAIAAGWGGGPPAAPPPVAPAAGEGQGNTPPDGPP